MVNLPSIEFTAWTRWSERSKISGSDKPGVYVLAHFTNPPSTVDIQAKEIIYIGETCRQSLQRRWAQFHRCAFNEGADHSGGIRYRKHCGRKGVEQLFVSAFTLPAGCLGKDLLPLFIRYVERKLIWDYARRWRKAPKFNQK